MLVTSLIFISGIRYYAEEAKRQVAYDKAEAILESIIGLHTYYSNTIVPRIQANGGVFEMRFHDNPESFPYPAVLQPISVRPFRPSIPIWTPASTATIRSRYAKTASSTSLNVSPWRYWKESQKKISPSSS
jgi:hypothetical protein